MPHPAHAFADLLCSRFREELPRLLSERQLTPYKLARRSHVQRQVIHNTLRGDTTPTLHVVARLCWGLQMRPEKLVEELRLP